MSKRSKVLVVIIVVVIVLSLFSFVDFNKESDKKLEQWEEEIVIPDNQLDPLNEKNTNSVFIIDVALKIEGVINKIFGIVLGLLQ